jgi:hypothetical protein
VSWSPGHAATGTLCVYTASTITIALYPPDLHSWLRLTSTDIQVAVIDSQAPNQEGAVRATVRAVGPGTATIATTAQALADAPDPAPQPWQLTITVIG